MKRHIIIIISISIIILSAGYLFSFYLQNQAEQTAESDLVNGQNMPVNKGSQKEVTVPKETPDSSEGNKQEKAQIQKSLQKKMKANQSAQTLTPEEKNLLFNSK